MPFASAGAHDVARVHLAQADAAGDRGDHARIRELQLRVVDVALVGLHRGLVLAHERLLRVDLLLRNRILREQRAIALDVDARVFEQRLVARQLSAGERELHLEGTRIDLGEEIALLHHLALLEGDLHQLAVDAAPDDDGVQRRHRAEREQVDVERALAHRRGDDGRRAQRGIALCAAFARACARRARRLGARCGRELAYQIARADGGDAEHGDGDPPAASPRP